MRIQLSCAGLVDYNRKTRDANIAVNNRCRKGETPVLRGEGKEAYVGRRDFIKTTTMASVAASLPGTAPAEQVAA